MDNVLNIISLIVLVVSAGFLFQATRIRKQTRAEFKKNEEIIESKQNEFNEFRMLAAGVTHEINNAISIIMGRAEQIVRKNQDPTLDKALTSIQSTCERIVTSVKGLRQSIYPDTTEPETDIDLGVLMSDVLNLSGQRLRNHGIQIKLKGLEKKFIKGRKNQLEQLLISLLNQSVERLESIQEKWVELVADEDPDSINIVFMDASCEVGDRVSHKQFNEILEKNHGHLVINQNNLVMEMDKPVTKGFHS